MSDAAAAAAKVSAFPTLGEMRAVDMAVAVATEKVDAFYINATDYLNDVFHHRVPSGQVTPADYGTFMLYLESMELSLTSSLDSIKRTREAMDNALWEAVDLDGSTSA